jgi:hypothetical protein
MIKAISMVFLSIRMRIAIKITKLQQVICEKLNLFRRPSKTHA